jgi:hypothetical protein
MLLLASFAFDVIAQKSHSDYFYLSRKDSKLFMVTSPSTVYKYDSAGRLILVAYKSPTDLGITSYQYDNVGNILVKVNLDFADKIHSKFRMKKAVFESQTEFESFMKRITYIMRYKI